MDERIPKQITVGCFTVVMERVRKLVVAKYQDLVDGLGGAIATSTRKQAENAIKAFEDIFSVLKKSPADIEGIAETREFIAEIPSKLPELKAQVDHVTKDYELLDNLFFQYTNADVKQRWYCYGLPHVIYDKIEACNTQLDKTEAAYNNAQKEAQDEFREELGDLERTINNFAQRKVEWIVDEGANPEEVDEHAAEVARTLERLVDAEALAKKFNSRENLFNVAVTDYSELARMTKTFEPYSALWTTMSLWQKSRKSWMYDSFLSLDAETIDKNIQVLSSAYTRAIMCGSDKANFGVGPDLVEKCVQSMQDVRDFAARDLPNGSGRQTRSGQVQRESADRDSTAKPRDAGAALDKDFGRAEDGPEFHCCDDVRSDLERDETAGVHAPDHQDW